MGLFNDRFCCSKINCEQSNNAYRTSTESQGSQTTMLPHSSHQQLVDIESAKDACVSMNSYLFTCKGAELSTLFVGRE